MKGVINRWEERTANFEQYRVNMALDYGGLDEIARAIVAIVDAVATGKLTTEEILQTPSVVFGFLDTAGQFSPDLVVRTGVKENEMSHTSGFFPLQASYAGWSFIPDDFPDLEPAVLLDCIKKFSEYQRRFGE